jgi:hypothetical protein
LHGHLPGHGVDVGHPPDSVGSKKLSSHESSLKKKVKS